MRRLVGTLVAPLAASLAAGAAPLAAAGAQGCTYDRCALKREGVFFSQRILAGVEGRVVARQGFAGFRLDSALAGSGRALAEARVHRREAALGGVLLLAGTALGAAAVIADSRDGRYEFRGTTAALVLGGTALTGVGGWRAQIADRALARALWWYNRDLPR
jgi:hypothetical protein